MKETIRKYWPPFLIYLLICCIRSFQRPEGDIHIYLKAANVFLRGDNMYPYYLYPPPSILIFAPLSLVEEPVGRVLWAIFNFILFIRILFLLYDFLEASILMKIKPRQLMLLILLSCMGMIDHNIQLGQMTIVMLWTSLEFCHLMNHKKELKAVFVLAFGIMMKLLPGIFLLWLFVKKKYKLIALVFIVLLSISLFPGLLNTHTSNQVLWIDWIKTINPFGNRFGVESSHTVISLNGFLLKYTELLTGFVSSTDVQTKWVSIIVNFFRIVLIMFLWSLYRKTTDKLSILEISISLLVCVLIFPHQMKYSMLLFTPAMILILLTLKSDIHAGGHITFISTIMLGLFLVFTIYGRDTIGDKMVDLLDSNRYFSWLILISLLKLGFIAQKKIKSDSRVVVQTQQE